MGNLLGDTSSNMKAFSGGTIHIEMLNDEVAFEAGQIIQGVVHMHLTIPCFDTE